MGDANETDSSNTSKQQAELHERVTSLSFRMPTVERLSKHAAEIPMLTDALKKEKDEIRMHVQHVKTLAEEYSRNSNVAKCSTAARGVAEELEMLTTRITKTEMAVSFARAELDTIQKILLTQGQFFSP